MLESPPAETGSPFSMAWDGDVRTMYHSPWAPTGPAEKVPLSFVVDLAQVFDVGKSINEFEF